MNAAEKEDAVTLEILSAIEEKSDLCQRHIADRLGVALGLANSYLKRCVRKGLLKMQHAPTAESRALLTSRATNNRPLSGGARGYPPPRIAEAHGAERTLLFFPVHHYHPVERAAVAASHSHRQIHDR
ncbi:MAG: winged helix-turn-helix transcriptional regulator [Gammaproteobacteria bacterium]